jgi:hypothetical protein
MEDFRNSGIRGAEGLEDFSHHFITKKVQRFKSQSPSEFLRF